MKLHPPAWLLVVFVVVLGPDLPAQTTAPAPVPSLAEPPAPGEVRGRIFNPKTGEYVRNARIRLVETGETTVSEHEGAFRLAPVPPGGATIEVTYTGYRSLRARIEVPVGGTVTRDFELASDLTEPASGAETTVLLEKFVVSSEREGSAKAIMDQRKSMNLTNTIASDSFGDNAEGNIGEFLKHVPGVEIEQFYGEVRNVRLRGLGSEYTAVTIDGQALASADANTGSSEVARAFTFEMASLNSMESIEVAKTISADVDANAPAGTINLRTKRAFDRAGRRVSWQVNVAAHSEEFSFNRTPGPGDSGRTLKLRPGGIFEYSDVFLNRRLGVVLNLSESNVFQETLITTVTYNRTPTPADPRPEVITALGFQHAPRFNRRFSGTLTTDFKATKSLVLSLGLLYNLSDLWTPQRSVTFNAGARALVVGAEPHVSFTTTSPAANVVSNPANTAKLGETVTVLPRFEYRTGSLVLDGRFAYSDSNSWYDPLGRRGVISNTNSPTVSGVSFRAARSSAADYDWRIVQLSGPDIATGASFTNPAITANDGRSSRSKLVSGELNATVKTTAGLPVTWKTGMKSRYEFRRFDNEGMAKRYDYAGATSATGAWTDYRSAYEYDMGMTGGGITSVSGNRIFLPDLQKIAQLFRSQPERFTQNLSATSYYSAYIANRKRYEEEIRAAFLMADAGLGRARLRLGLRWEDTLTAATEFDPRTPAEVRAAGYTVSGGRATTIPGLQFQYLSQPKIRRTGGFDNLFPSGSLKYLLTENLNLLLGYSTTIRRATYNNLAGVWAIDDVNLRVTAPNAGLKPETSENLAARLAYFFEPVGQLSVSVFQNRVNDLHLTNTLTAEEFGNTDPDLTGYQFVTTNNGAERVLIRGLEVEYSQALSFLPAPFKRLSVRAAYTRNYAEIITPNLSPHSVSGGLNYVFRRFTCNLNANWSDNYPLTASGIGIRRHRTSLDGGASWRLSQHLTMSVTGRNLLNSPYVNLQYFGPPNPAVWTRHETTGTSWTFALKGTY
jgi:TonB-dependent receptor